MELERLLNNLLQPNSNGAFTFKYNLSTVIAVILNRPIRPWTGHSTFGPDHSVAGVAVAMFWWRCGGLPTDVGVHLAQRRAGKTPLGQLEKEFLNVLVRFVLGKTLHGGVVAGCDAQSAGHQVLTQHMEQLMAARRERRHFVRFCVLPLT